MGIDHRDQCRKLNRGRKIKKTDIDHNYLYSYFLSNEQKMEQ